MNIIFIETPEFVKKVDSFANVIYYFYDMKGEIWFLDMYVKNEKADLYEFDKKKLYNIIKEKIK
jgi:hypothetical protein